MFTTGILGAHDVVLLVLRVLLGTFYVLARFRWVYDPSRPDDPWFNHQRHVHLIWKLGDCHYPKSPGLAAILAMTEISAGLGVLVGLMTVLAALALVVVTSFATACTWKVKICEQHPVDDVDWISCYLWRVEFLYLSAALCLVLAGPGAYSLDWLIFR